MKDYTLEAVQRQLKSMRCERYEVMLRNEAGGQVCRRRDLTADDVFKAVPWFKRQNRNGWHIYIQPSPDLGRALILVDDADMAGVEALTAHGYAPACTVETSPKNFQAWIDLGPEPMPDEERRAVSKMLADAVNGDPHSVGAIHMGRLAGFTNRKPKYQDASGRYPFVLCRSSSGGVCPRAQEARAWAKLAAAMETAKANPSAGNAGQVAPADSEALAVPSGAGRGGISLRAVRILRQNLPDVGERVARAVAEYEARMRAQGREQNRSDRDWGIVQRLMFEGYSDAQIWRGLQPVIDAECAQHLRTSKGANYLSLTIRNASRMLFG